MFAITSNCKTKNQKYQYFIHPNQFICIHLNKVL
ncbi:hypothetical protein ACUNWD_08040 [Sunxiuqinia sp. A32]